MNKRSTGTIVLHFEQPECERLGALYVDAEPFKTHEGFARIVGVCEDPECPETGVVFKIEPWPAMDLYYRDMQTKPEGEVSTNVDLSGLPFVRRWFEAGKLTAWFWRLNYLITIDVLEKRIDIGKHSACFRD